MGSSPKIERSIRYIALGCILLAGSLAARLTASDHWSFRPVERPQIPEVENDSWPSDDLDRFILSRLEDAGLTPAPHADRRTLMRRLSFTLTGLPPSLQDLDQHLTVEAAESDPSLAKYVDSLMESEAFGDRWARHWLDHVRYRPARGRNDGNDPYRLWVVRAFQEDMPLYRFVRMQIAGDLLPGANPETEVNLDGMVAVRPFSLKRRHHEQIDLLGRTFLGMSLFCARCHDHKHEPLSRADYYAMQGLFESSQVVDAPFIREREKFAAYMEGLARKTNNETRMKKELKQFARVSQLVDLRERIAREREKLDDPKNAKNRAKVEKSIAKLVKDEKKRAAEIEKRGLALDAPEALEYIRLQRENKAFDAKWKDVFQFEAFVDQSDPANIVDSAPPEFGVKVKPGQDPPRESPVPRRFPVVLAGPDQKPLGERTKGSGRLELAEWLSDPAHPITTRLMVNRIWYYLLGEGLTPSLSNFGHSGRSPTHPLLLDYLSDELARNKGSLKTQIRRIVLSSTFQQSSRMEIGLDERDRRVAFFGLTRPKRLEAESIWRTLHSLAQDPGSKERVRPPSIEFVREAGDLFDGADSSLIVPRRTSSVTTLQALFFLNSEHVRTSAERIAERVLQLSDDSSRIRQAFRFLYGREASDDEVKTGEEFLAGWNVDAKKSGKRRKKNGPPPETLAKWGAYLQVLISTNEFLFVD